MLCKKIALDRSRMSGKVVGCREFELL
jgi:hypothetical protein